MYENSEQQPSALDSEEMLGLALMDTRMGRHEEAIARLKKLLGADPNHAKAQYLLAAEHAELGLLDRAIDEMTRAVSLDPNIPAAHFQLGLLYFCKNQFEDARRYWQPLDGFTGAGEFAKFKTALLHLAANQLPESLAELDQALSVPPQNVALVRDMQRIRQTVLQKMTGAQAEKVSPQQGKHVLLGKYDEDPTGTH